MRLFSLSLFMFLLGCQDVSKESSEMEVEQDCEQVDCEEEGSEGEWSEEDTAQTVQGHHDSDREKRSCKVATPA